MVNYYGHQARLKIEKKLGRRLSIHEVVHHVDKNHKNNKLDNLKIMSQEEHSSLHHAGSKKKYNQPNGQWNKLSNTIINRIIFLHLKGYNYSQIGRILNISDFTARKYILKFKEKCNK